MVGEHYLPEITGSGVALLDYDQDRDLDVYLVQMNLLDPSATADDALVEPPGSLPLSDRLFRNELSETGTLGFTDVTESSGLSRGTGFGMGATVGDVDNDGDPDIYVTNLGANQMWLNQGDGTFVEAPNALGADDRGWSVPAVFFDFDRDGWLDLFVGNYVDFNLGTHRECQTATGAPDWCGPLSYRPTVDRLLRNRNGERFVDVTRRAGLAQEAGNALGALVADLDGDRLLDLYVANDQMPNFLWVNQGDGTFREDALLVGAAVSGDGLAQASMGVDAADVDGDGDLDLLLTHLTGEPNTFYRNEGGGSFLDTSVPSGLGMASWQLTGFGAAWIDYDNDSRLDLLTVNGAVRTIPEQLAADIHYPLRQPKQLFHNLGGGRFETTTAIGGEVLAIEEVSRGAAFGDLDNDGDTDVVINNSNGPARLLVNDCGARRPWLGLVVLEEHGRAALGAEVTVALAGGSRLVRRVHVDGSYASANDPRVLVGLADRGDVVGITVDWAAGPAERFEPLPLGRYHRLVQGTGVALPP